MVGFEAGAYDEPITSTDQFLEGSTHLQKIICMGKLDLEFVHQVKVSNTFVLSNCMKLQNCVVWHFFEIVKKHEPAPWMMWHPARLLCLGVEEIAGSCEITGGQSLAGFGLWIGCAVFDCYLSLRVPCRPNVRRSKKQSWRPEHGRVWFEVWFEMWLSWVFAMSISAWWRLIVENSSDMHSRPLLCWIWLGIWFVGLLWLFYFTSFVHGEGWDVAEEAKAEPLKE